MYSIVISIPGCNTIIHVTTDNTDLLRGLVFQYYPYITYSYGSINTNACVNVHIEVLGNIIRVQSAKGDKINFKVCDNHILLYKVKSIIQRSLLEKDGFLYFHSACVAYERFAFVLLGRANSGKSTLSTYLSSVGMNYLTDDCTIVCADKKQVVPYPKIIQLREDTCELLKRYQVMLPTFDTGVLSHPRGVLPPYSFGLFELAAFIKIELSNDPPSITEIKDTKDKIKILAENLYSSNSLCHKITVLSSLVNTTRIFKVCYSDMEYVYNEIVKTIMQT